MAPGQDLPQSHPSDSSLQSSRSSMTGLRGIVSRMEKRRVQLKSLEDRFAASHFLFYFICAL
jgi:hypothetical protein